MSTFIGLAFISMVTVSVIMVLAWLWALKLKNNSIVDVFWAFNFTIIAFIIFLLADGNLIRKQIVCGLAALWSIRLGIYLAIRVGSHIREEEGRYKQLRLEWGTAKFFFFFQMQAISTVFLSIPFFIVALNKIHAITFLEYTGAVLWLLCIFGEGLADWQLQHFKKNPSNKGRVCEYGLWNYSRHPNYFFQFMIWISVFIFSLSSPYGWLAVVCPLSIGYLIFKVTGIPMTEEQAVRSKGEAYKAYQRTTSAFIPWFKKNR